MSADCSSIAITASKEQMFHTARNNCIRFSAQFFFSIYLFETLLLFCRVMWYLRAVVLQ